MDGSELHAAGLACIKTAFGFVLDTGAIQRLGLFSWAGRSAV